MTIAACLKFVDTRPELDPAGTIHDSDDRFSGVSPADQAALEWALRSADAWGEEVHVVAAGPAAADRVLRDALAAGAVRATRIDIDTAAPSDVIAAEIATIIEGSRIVWCGDCSIDRGSGSVPAFLAAHLGAAQALGLVHVELTGAEEIEALRRLDGGRRERVRATAPAVLSVEGAVARLRRASLASALAARSAAIEVVNSLPLTPTYRPTRPFRPRARVLPGPAGDSALDRIRALTDAGMTASHGEIVALAPPDAADRIIEALRDWGYLTP